MFSIVAPTPCAPEPGALTYLFGAGLLCTFAIGSLAGALIVPADRRDRAAYAGLVVLAVAFALAVPRIGPLATFLGLAGSALAWWLSLVLWDLAAIRSHHRRPVDPDGKRAAGV